MEENMDEEFHWPPRPIRAVLATTRYTYRLEPTVVTKDEKGDPVEIKFVMWLDGDRDVCETKGFRLDERGHRISPLGNRQVPYEIREALLVLIRPHYAVSAAYPLPELQSHPWR